MWKPAENQPPRERLAPSRARPRGGPRGRPSRRKQSEAKNPPRAGRRESGFPEVSKNWCWHYKLPANAAEGAVNLPASRAPLQRGPDCPPSLFGLAHSTLPPEDAFARPDSRAPSPSPSWGGWPREARSGGARHGHLPPFDTDAAHPAQDEARPPPKNLASRAPTPDIDLGRLAVDEPFANWVRSGRKQP